MGLGTGLGAFVEGIMRGADFANDMSDRASEREDRERRRKWDEEDRSFELGERNRAKSNRDAIDAIQAEAKTTFDAGVASGKYDPDQFQDFYTSYVLPKMHRELLLQGDNAGADALARWGESEAAKKGAKLFGSALFKSQSGDLGGAIDDAIEAGKVKGYIGEGFTFEKKEEIVDSNGQVVGYRVHMSDGEGNQLEQDITADDVPNLIVQFASPEQVWQSQQTAKADKAKRGAEIEDYATKKKIDAAAAGPENTAKDRSAAIKVLREQSAASLDAVPFDQLPWDEQEAAIQKEIGLQRGTTPAPMPSSNLVVDQLTGGQVPTGLGGVPTAPGQSPFTRGLVTAPTPAAAPAGPVPTGLGQQPASPPIASTGSQQGDAGLPIPSRAQVLQNAQAAQVAGEDPNEIARVLTAAGIGPGEWPPGLANSVNPGGTARTAPAY